MLAADARGVVDPSTHQPDRHRVLIEPARGWQGVGLGELWRYRELLRALAVRDVKVRYKQTVLGFLWAVLQPFLFMVVFTVLLHNVGGVQGDPGVPYPVFTYGGLLIWNYFSDGVSRAAASLVTNNVLVSKVYFPRLTAPLSGVLSPLLDFGVGLVVLVGLMVHYDYGVSSSLALLPLCLLLAVVAASGFGIWFSALNVKYRDVSYAMSFVVQIWMFLSPVVYTSKSVQGTWRLIYSLNPMGGIVLGFRRGIVGHGPFEWSMLGVGTLVSVVVLLSGVVYFRRVERTFADSI